MGNLTNKYFVFCSRVGFSYVYEQAFLPKGLIEIMIPG